MLVALWTTCFQLSFQTAALAQQCLAVTDIEPVPSTESSETLKGKCPIRQCYGTGATCSCYDRLYTTEVANTCQGEVTIQVDAGTNYPTGQHKLGKGAHEKYSCQEARDSCSGVKISLVGVGSETTNQFRPSPPKTPAVSQAVLDEAKRKADEARAKAREAEAKAAQKRAADSAEKNKLKEAAKSVPSWCQGMISACEQRASSIANASQGTQSQCNAYCQILRIENCNGASTTVQQAAQACTAGAQRDQRAETERAQAAKERKEREEAEERRKWHCFGENGNVRQGFEQCKAECSAYFSANHCSNVCYASGDGSIAKGRSCYREP
jgi:hypothetical protein